MSAGLSVRDLNVPDEPPLHVEKSQPLEAPKTNSDDAVLRKKAVPKEGLGPNPTTDTPPDGEERYYLGSGLAVTGAQAISYLESLKIMATHKKMERRVTAFVELPNRLSRENAMTLAKLAAKGTFGNAGTVLSQKILKHAGFQSLFDKLHDIKVLGRAVERNDRSSPLTPTF